MKTAFNTTTSFAVDFLTDMINDFTSLNEVNLPSYTIGKNEEGTTIVEIELPGYTKSDISLDIENSTVYNFLVLSYKGEETKRKKKFTRNFRVSKNVDVSKITAELIDGILTITLPVSEKAKPKNIKIN